MPAITRELLEKFWLGLCTEEEATLVEAYFREHPQDESLLEEFESAGADPIAEEDRVEMLGHVVNATRPRKATIRRIGGMMAAASLLVVVVTAWMYYKGEKKQPEHAAPLEAAIWVGKHNTDSKQVRVALPDSTEVVLLPGATILYRKDFGSYEKREVKVDGQVVFSVRKNKEMPFVVYSEGVRTTVLGTIFEVDGDKATDHIRVRLLQGKVKVSMDAQLGDPSKEYYLKPGEEFVYGKYDKSIVVRDFKGTGGGYAAHRVKRVPGRPDSLANWYMFNNQGLADVFDQLAIIYNVEIQYSNAELRNKYFIGKLDRKDSLHKILSDIALLNHLSVVEREGSYIVRKSK